MLDFFKKRHDVKTIAAALGLSVALLSYRVMMRRFSTVNIIKLGTLDELPTQQESDKFYDDVTTMRLNPDGHNITHARVEPLRLNLDW